LNRSTRMSCALGLALVVAGLVPLACSNNSESTARVEQHKRMAGELQNNKLYQAAIDEYNKALAFTGLDDKQRANLNYLVARIYFQNLSDYESAAAHYIKAREYDPNGSFATEASKKLIASLERLGNITDARRQLSSAADLGDSSDHSNDVIVATIAGKPIYLSAIEDRIASLPPEVQKQLQNIKAKRDYLRQFVGAELIYNAAIREDVVSRPEIVRQHEQLMKRLVVEQYVVEKVMPQVQIDTSDVRNFYLANKDSRYGGKSYDSVRGYVFQDYQAEKAEAAYSDYISRLATAEQVEFFDHRIK